MNNTTTARILLPRDVFAMGDLLNAVTRNDKVKWMDEHGSIHTGELRSLVKGRNNFGFADYGTDVRDMWVWVTGSVCETTFSVAHAISVLPEGGMVFGTDAE